MKYQYQFKNKELFNAVSAIFGKEYVEKELQRQMPDEFDYFILETADHNKINSSALIPKEEVESTRVYDPNDWNPFPQIKPPAYCHWLVQFESGEVKVIEYVRQEFSPFSVGDFWNAPKLSKVIAFRKLPEPFQPKETK